MADCSLSIVGGRLLHSRIMVSFERQVRGLSEALGQELSGTLIPHMSFESIMEMIRVNSADWI